MASRITIKTGVLHAISAGATAVFCLYCSTAAWAQGSAPLQGWGSGAQTSAPAPWRVVVLPLGKAPLSSLEVVDQEGAPALRLRTAGSYGTLHHAMPAGTRVLPGQRLAWQWKLEQALAQANLQRKDGDDAALKVCALYDLPLDAIAFGERTLLRLARQATGEYLPGATVCYVWDTKLAQDTLLPNAYSRRVRWLVLDGNSAPLGRWRAHTRDLHADFLRAFGDESSSVPPLLAIVVGADADNTGGQSLGYLRPLQWQQP